MLVVATRLGYYGIKRRNPGEVFKLKDEKHFSKTWMKPCDESADADDSFEDAVEVSAQPVRRSRPKKVRAIPDDDGGGQSSQSDEDVI